MECNVRGIPVFYEEIGTGLPVIAIHGFTLDHHSIKNSLEPVFAPTEGWRRIYPDLPGMGQTPGSGEINGSDDMLEVILDFIEAVIPGQEFIVIGESYGGYLAQGVVARMFNRVQGLGLICPVEVALHSARNLPPLTVVHQDPDLVASLTPEEAVAFTAISVVQDRAVLARFREEVLPGIKKADQKFLGKLLQSYAFSFDVTKLPAPFPKPTLFLLGRQDNIVGYKDAWPVLENYPRASFAVLDRAGHNLSGEQSRLFNSLVEEWLRRVSEGLAR